MSHAGFVVAPKVTTSLSGSSSFTNSLSEIGGDAKLTSYGFGLGYKLDAYTLTASVMSGTPWVNVPNGSFNGSDSEFTSYGVNVSANLTEFTDLPIVLSLGIMLKSTTSISVNNATGNRIVGYFEGNGYKLGASYKLKFINVGLEYLSHSVDSKDNLIVDNVSTAGASSTLDFSTTSLFIEVPFEFFGNSSK